MKKVLIISFILIISIILYGFIINPKGFIIKSEEIKVDNLSTSFEGFKILQLSDFYLKKSNDLKAIEKIALKVKELKPDIIIFTGDLLDKENTLNNKDITKLKEILNNMETTLYKYAIYGDNDKFDEYTTIMEESGFKILDNESKYIFYKDVKPIKITGITNLIDIDNSLSLDDLDTTLNIVITHYPDNFDTLKNKDVDIVFAGHSLNGQIRLPFYGGIIKNEGSKKYVSGNFLENNTKLYISGGISQEKINFRLFNKPEINLYTLTIA